MKEKETSMSRLAVTGNRITTIRGTEGKGDVYTSEYQAAYSDWKWQTPRKTIKPTVTRGVSTLSYPAETVSCTHRAFVPHKLIGPPKNYKPKHDEFTTPDVKMDTNTTYNVEFKEKVCTPRPPYRPDEQGTFNAPFNAKSVYQAHFAKFSPEEIEACRVEKKAHEDNLGKEEKTIFDAQSTAQASFRPMGQVIPVSCIKPEENTHIDPTQPFETETTHRAEFTHKTIPKKTPTTPPHPPKQNPIVTTAAAMKAMMTNRQPERRGRMEDVSVFKRDFIAHKAVAPDRSYKPKRSYQRNPARFDGRTTNRMSYQPITIAVHAQRPPWANRDRAVVISKAQRARLDLLTCYQDSFRDPSRIIPMEKCRGVSYKVPYGPSGSTPGAGGDKRPPMEGKTSYKMSYVPYGRTKRAESYKLNGVYSIPTAPFLGKATTAMHYKGTPACPAKSCKPPARPHSSPGKMSSWTTYRASFGRRAPICRAPSCPPPAQQ